MSYEAKPKRKFVEAMEIDGDTSKVTPVKGPEHVDLSTEKLSCDTCGGAEDVKTVQMRQTGKAAIYVPKKTRLCRVCRDKAYGSWRYRR